MQFDDNVTQSLIDIIVLYNPKKKGFFSKPMMSYHEKNEFVGIFKQDPDTKGQRVGMEPESLSGALSSVKIIANNIGGDCNNMVILLQDTKDDFIIGFIFENREYRVVIGENYSSKKEESTFKIV